MGERGEKTGKLAEMLKIGPSLGGRTNLASPGEAFPLGRLLRRIHLENRPRPAKIVRPAWPWALPGKDPRGGSAFPGRGQHAKNRMLSRFLK